MTLGILSEATGKERPGQRGECFSQPSAFLRGPGRPQDPVPAVSGRDRCGAWKGRMAVPGRGVR